MQLSLLSRSLSRRIVASVAIGLALILLLFGIVALWRINDSVEAAYRTRVVLAEALVSRLDDVLRYYLASLEREAAELRTVSEHPFTNLRLRLGSFATISVTDATGITLWTDPGTPDITIGSPLRHPSVELVLRTGEPQITEFASPVDPERVFACLAVPLRDARGQLTGALMAELDPSHPALNLLPSREMGRGIQAQLMNTAGQLLDGTEGSTSKAAKEHQVLLADLMAARQAGYRTHEPPPEANAPSHVVAYAPSLLLPSWGVTVEQPSDTLLATSRHILERQILFGIAALLLAVAITWFGVRRVVRPLKHLTAVAERFAAGQLDEPVNLARDDEIGILAHAFDTMRVRLRASLAEVAEWNRELERRVATRTAEIERRNRELAHLNAIATAVSGSLDVKAMLEHTLDHVLQITGAEAGCFWMLEGDGAALTPAAQRRLPAALQSGRMCLDSCLCSRAARLNKVLLADKEDLDPQAICRAANLGSALAVPVPSGVGVQAVLFLISSHLKHFQQSELATLAAIGQQVGIALTNARLYQSLGARERERAELLQKVMDAQEEERRRLAQELHDETSQALASLQLGLGQLAAGTDDLERVRHLATQLQGIAAQTLAEVHRLAVELRPSVLDDVGLVPAIGRYLQECGLRVGLSVDFASVGADHFRLIPPVETAIYRIVQEALTNVVQHAQAQHVSVLLERRGEKLIVVIEDDGRGFDLAAKQKDPLEARLGLAGMEERASLIGAKLTIETAPSRGTTVFLEIPIAPNSRGEEADGEVTNRSG